MFNTYVHAAIRGLPANALDDDAFIGAIWRELPDAGLGGRDDLVTITLSQFALTDQRATSRQLKRIARALATLGWPGAEVEVDEVVREDIRDDLMIALSAVRWHGCRFIGAARRGARRMVSTKRPCR